MQCNSKNCFWLEFAGDATPFRIADFLSFKKQVEDINIEAMLADTSRNADYAVLMPFRSQRCFVLTVSELLALKELLQGTMFMLELNSVVKSCLTSRPVVNTLA